MSLPEKLERHFVKKNSTFMVVFFLTGQITDIFEIHVKYNFRAIKMYLSGLNE